MRRFAARLFVLSTLFWSLGCDEAFDPASRVSSLRVLAVQPEPASGIPGEPVHLSMLLHDGRASFDDTATPPEPTVLWIGGCHNPPSRQFFGCYPAIRGLAAQLADASEGGAPPALEPVPGLVGIGREFDFTIPENILDTPRLDTDPIHFGVSYVFFAACAGELRLLVDSGDSLPLGCFDPESGKRLGPQDYVEGFTTVYTYEGSLNHNPVLTGIRFGGAEVTSQTCSSDSDCEDLAATAPHIEEFVCTDSERCAPVLERCDPGADEDRCAEYDVEPLVDRDSAEPDPTAPESSGEILWLNFFADAGSFANETRLLNDRETGWIDNHESSWRPIRREAGTVHMFTTVHDNRGGAAWGSFEVIVKDP